MQGVSLDVDVESTLRAGLPRPVFSFRMGLCWSACMKPSFAVPLLVVVAALSFAQGAQAMACYENKVTNAFTCFDAKEVREKNGVRWAPLYSGGPAGVRATGFTIHSNCATGVTHLKDRDGVSFAGGSGNETENIRSLRKWLCEAKLKK